MKKLKQEVMANEIYNVISLMPDTKFNCNLCHFHGINLY